MENSVHTIPDWLSSDQESEEIRSSNRKKTHPAIRALVIQEFVTYYPMIMELISSGYTLTNAINSLPVGMDIGAFMRWVKASPDRSNGYVEAKALRTEVWAGKLIEYSEATDSFEDIQRSKLKIDTLKWLMERENRKTYGDVRQVELTNNISITAALTQANSRISNVHPIRPELDVSDVALIEHTEDDPED